MFLLLTLGMQETTRPYHHGDLRRALLDSALEMLREDGGWQFTLRELARRAGVSHTAAYKHFPDKAGLLSELARVGFQRLRLALEAAQASQPTLQDELRANFRAYVAFGAANPNLYRLMFSADARLASSEALRQEAVAALDVLKDLVARGQAVGWLRHRDVRHQAAAAWAQLHGLALLTIDRMLRPETVGPEAVEASLDVLFEGLAVAAS